MITPITTAKTMAPTARARVSRRRGAEGEVDSDMARFLAGGGGDGGTLSVCGIPYVLQVTSAIELTPVKSSVGPFPDRLSAGPEALSGRAWPIGRAAGPAAATTAPRCPAGSTARW